MDSPKIPTIGGAAAARILERQADVDRLAEIDAEVLAAEQAVEALVAEVLEAERAHAHALFASNDSAPIKGENDR